MTPGTRLGPYEIVAPLGAGGMGEVYKARDTRLDRSVAIKILPAELAQNAQFKIRFEREAKTISRLSHPHICALYDVGENYLVMELLEGETLADRLARGALPIAEAVQIAIHMADALDKAHRAGIIHRDLKPGNVMLTPAGVKLLDFGLAKSDGGPPVAEATELKPLTQEGTIVGTLQYMAPEQLEGREADGRADIFALGAILYEMLTGRRAFDGASRASVIAKILGAEPPAITSLQRLTPPALEDIVKRCLAKHPSLRWQCAGDLRRELELLSEEKVAEKSPSLRSRVWLVAAIVLALLAAGEAAWLAAHRERPSVAERLVRFTIDPPPNSLIKLGNDVGAPVVSPDGKSVAFVASDSLSGRRTLWVRELASVASRRVEGTEGAMFPFWSPDGKSIGFFAAGKLKRFDVSAGGMPLTLCAASYARGGAWGADGKILFSPSPSEGIFRISASGGAVNPVTRLDTKAGEVSHRWPYILPDGNHFLMFVRQPGTASGSQTGDAIYVADARTGERKFLERASSAAIYVHPGFLLYVRDRVLFSRPFDLQSLSLAGEATPVLQNVQFHPSGFAMLSAANGVLCYQTGSLTSELRMVDRKGTVTASVGEPAEYNGPSLDAAHRQILMSVTDPTTGYQDIWHYDKVRKVTRRVTFHPADDFACIVSPDGRRVVFASNRSGFPQMFVKSIDSAEQERPIGGDASSSAFARFPLSWSSDGRYIAFREIASNTQDDILIHDFKDNSQRRFLGSEFSEAYASFSPSGKWIAYTSDESGRPEVYVTTFPAGSPRWQISSGGATQPRWRADERELYYVSADSNMMAVPLETRPNFKAGIAQRLFSCELRSSRLEGNEYDVSPDGQQFLLNTTAGHPRSLPLTVVVGWKLPPSQ